MTETSDAIRRKRLHYRAWHRGSREMDLLLGRFADRNLATMRGTELDAFERIIETPDPDLLSLLTGRSSPPARLDHALLRRIARNAGRGDTL